MPNSRSSPGPPSYVLLPLPPRNTSLPAFDGVVVGVLIVVVADGVSLAVFVSWYAPPMPTVVDDEPAVCAVASMVNVWLAPDARLRSQPWIEPSEFCDEQPALAATNFI